MSSRTIRKLENKSIEDELAEINSKLIEKSKSKKKGKKKVKPRGAHNAFAVFLEDEEDEDENNEDEHEDEEQNDADDKEKNGNSEESHNIEMADGTEDGDDNDDEFVDAKEQMKGKQKKLKRKNRKGGKKTKAETIDQIDEEALEKLLSQVELEDVKSGRRPKKEDECEAILLEPSAVLTLDCRLFTAAMFKRCRRFVSPDRRYLDPDREYQGLFGKLSNAAIRDADSTASSFVTPEILKQIKRMSRRVRGWGGPDHRSVPGRTRKLTLTKIRDDWIPTNRKPLVMEEMKAGELKALIRSKHPDDWDEAVDKQVRADENAGIKYFRMTEGPLYSRALTTEFFISIAIEPDHESIIKLLQKAPYHLESILQVASILQRQGDKSNTNGLIERALFIFDWSLKNTFDLGNGCCRLPFEFYLNRQIYLSVFRYITVLTRKSTLYTAFNYCKLLFSFDPANDPYGVRYFIDYYAFLSDEFQYVVDLFNSPLIQCYEEWITPSLCYTAALCHWKLGHIDEARQQLRLAVQKHPYTGCAILLKLFGASSLSSSYEWPVEKEVSSTVEIATAVYTVRVGQMLNDPQLKNFVTEELKSLLSHSNASDTLKEDDKYYLNNLEEIPHNLLRHVILSDETSAMAKIPESFWSSNEVYEFDILPPEHGTKIYDYLDQNRAAEAVINRSAQEVDRQQIQQLIDQAHEAQQNRNDQQ